MESSNSPYSDTRDYNEQIDILGFHFFSFKIKILINGYTFVLPDGLLIVSFCVITFSLVDKVAQVGLW
ncbi:hypothetical protein [Aquimarina sp. RZ0]|uniref:hypothetical protein n=1 Tax=Aquimarina sp. RZ0 TaxID=2607730 RepID=UPI0011F3943D|nr:hypothetical protein [Aquimarina sp. RZ0]KAA1242649.1 hypothetical protein F0000_24660 [Aquimarina sp. RZ0]